jgi:hypothetical protein
MQNMNETCEMYSEQEVADLLDITISRLHDLLDQHIFNEGTPRPENLTFTNSELVLLGFWQRTQPNPKVVRMPRRH